MLGQVRYAVGQKIAQNGNHYGFVGVDSQETDGPSGGVLGAEGNFISLLDTYFIKEDMEFFYVGSEVGETECVAALIVEGVLVPVAFNCFL